MSHGSKPGWRGGILAAGISLMVWTGCDLSTRNPAPAPRAEQPPPQTLPAESPALSEGGQALQALVKGGLEEQVAVAYMKRHHPEFDPPVDEILALNRHGVPGNWLAQLIAPATQAVVPSKTAPATSMEISEAKEMPGIPAASETVMSMADPAPEPTGPITEPVEQQQMALGAMPAGLAAEPSVTTVEAQPSFPEGSTTTTTTTTSTTLTTSQGQQVIIQETQPPATVVVQTPAPVIHTSTTPLVIQPPLTTYPSNVQVFYQDLAPYGDWVQIEPYGWCWQPTVVRADIQWRPYVDQGQWVWTDCGWYWQSNYSWGWAPFHYGRWATTPAPPLGLDTGHHLGSELGQLAPERHLLRLGPPSAGCPLQPLHGFHIPRFPGGGLL